MMPKQLARARRPKRQRRVLIETLRRINVKELRLSQTLRTTTLPGVAFTFPFISAARSSAEMVELAHSNIVQRFRIKWQRVGFGVRPAFLCDQCRRPTFKLYFHCANLSCRRCIIGGAIYASQTCNKHSRPILQATRLQYFINHKRYLRKTTQSALKARLASLGSTSSRLPKRVSSYRVQLPITNYNVAPLTLPVGWFELERHNARFIQAQKPRDMFTSIRCCDVHVTASRQRAAACSERQACNDFNVLVAAVQQRKQYLSAFRDLFSAIFSGIDRPRGVGSYPHPLRAGARGADGDGPASPRLNAQKRSGIWENGTQNMGVIPGKGSPSQLEGFVCGEIGLS